MRSCFMGAEDMPAAGAHSYGNDLLTADGAGAGLASRGWFSTDNICRTFASSDAPPASSSALAELAFRILKEGAL